MPTLPKLAPLKATPLPLVTSDSMPDERIGHAVVSSGGTSALFAAGMAGAVKPVASSSLHAASIAAEPASRVQAAARAGRGDFMGCFQVRSHGAPGGACPPRAGRRRVDGKAGVTP